MKPIKDARHWHFISTMSEPERFWSKVDKSGIGQGCWNWTAGKYKTGYANFTIERNGKWKTIYQGEGYKEPIRGQGVSMFFGSDGRRTAKAKPFTRYQCGECGVILDSEYWPSVCSHCGAYNYP